MKLSDDAKSLMSEPFKTDSAGKPIAEFEMKLGPAPRNEIQVKHHALKALPHLEAIDAHISGISQNLGKTGFDVNQLMLDWDMLAAHASKIMGQAIYLDTSDRNSWPSIRQSMIHEPGKEKFHSAYAAELKGFWKGSLQLSPKPKAEEQGFGVGL